MMTDHLQVEVLSAYADGELTGSALGRAEHHLEECAACRGALHGLRTLLRNAAELPRGVTPPASVWVAVQRGIRGRRPRRSWRRFAGLAIAAGLVAAAVLVSRWPGRSAKVMSPPEAEVSASFASIERHYRSSIDELRQTLAQQRGTLSPTTVRVLERSVAVIDTAIAEARAALAADPGNRALTEILSAGYEHKVSLLQRATKLSPST